MSDTLRHPAFEFVVLPSVDERIETAVCKRGDDADMIDSVIEVRCSFQNVESHEGVDRRTQDKTAEHDEEGLQHITFSQVVHISCWVGDGRRGRHL